MILVGLAFAAPPAGTEAFTRAAVLDFHQDGIHAADAEVEAAWKAACDAGAPLACARSWSPGDLPAAAEVLAVPCTNGDVLACLVVGWSRAQSGAVGTFDPPAPLPSPASAAVPLLQTACDGGVERGCADLGALYQLGVGVEKDFGKAQPLLQTACQVGELSACRRLGAAFHSGQGAERDLAKARTYYGKACDGGMLGGCNSLGLLAHLAQDGASDPPAAVALYLRACDGGHQAACNNLEKLYSGGLRPDADPPGALAIWEQGCARGVGIACANGADLAADAAMMGTADPAKALALRERGCELGEAYACGALGHTVLATDFPRGSTLLTASCEAGILASCQALSAVVGDRGSPQYDADAAARLNASACVNGDPAACQALGDALWKGVGAEKDRTMAAQMYRRACDGGIPKACKRAN